MCSVFFYNVQFYDELADGKDSGPICRSAPVKPSNKIIKFKDSDSSGDEDDSSPTEDPGGDKNIKESGDKPANKQFEETEEENVDKPAKKQFEESEEENEGKPAKKQCTEVDAKCEMKHSSNAKEKSIDELIEEELKEMGDKNKVALIFEAAIIGIITILAHKS